MTKRRAPKSIGSKPEPSATLIIDAGYSSPFIVHSGREFDPIATFKSLTAAQRTYPEACVTEAAKRKAGS